MRKGMRRAILVLLALLTLGALIPAPMVLAQGTATVSVSPPSQSVNVGQNATVEIRVDSVTNLYGVDIRLSFDSSKLDAVDADGNSANGIQIQPGSFLDPAQGFMAQNIANNTTGQVQYVFALMSPAAPVSGSGVLARIVFTGKAAGTAAITLTSVTLSNAQAQPITATVTNGAVTVVPTNGTTPTTTPTTGTPTVTPVPGCSGTSYTVVFGDTLFSIARRFGVTVEAIMAANGISNPNIIYAGRVLCIPTTGGVTPPPGCTPQNYTVVFGDTLFSIARRFNTTVQAIAAANGIVNPNCIRAGQVLVIQCGGGTIPPSPGPGCAYTVRFGDTVYGIAFRFGVSPFAIIQANGLHNPNRIFAGQRLIIPGASC